jgi:hypothetical protein
MAMTDPGSPVTSGGPADGSRPAAAEEEEEEEEKKKKKRDPFALEFAWLIVGVAALVSIGLVVAQLAAGWPFDPTKTTANREVLDSADEVVTLTETSEDDGGARDALWRAVAGIAALTAGLLAWGRLEQSRRQHQLDRQAAERAVDAQRLAVEAQELATRNQETVEAGQRTGRYTTAVEQLGHVDRAVRLGALYALEALAHDSYPHDRATICEVICAYARHHSTRRTADGEAIIVTDETGHEVPALVNGLAEDYRAAITIALRLPLDWNLERNLDGTVLTGFNFAEQLFPRVSFRRATFLGPARFGEAAFADEADFAEVTFTERAELDGTMFERGAYFGDATFKADAICGMTVAHVADFRRATFAAAGYFGGATFNGQVIFADATFIGGADFGRARFAARSAYFDGATFTNGAVLPPGFEPGKGFEQRADGRWYNRPDSGGDAEVAGIAP